MAHKHKHGRGRPRYLLTCPGCATKREATPAELLGRVASALNAARAAGIDLKLQHGSVKTREGYVLEHDDGWVARTRTWTPFSPPPEADDDGTD